ncbi:hypothetical protein PIB30_000344 [Stylosanthes scabra]|uniref:F-box associated domain-containing protein n=1 Tax=Stylosanthes scabra TaxID=79078 RepID=A0ABU6T293_9FABA|nr:hypothetical protein [Stylosanthes scabra]
MSGYAFGYKKDTDNYYVANLSKCHIKDSFVHCNIFSSAEGEWKRGYIKDAGIKVLSSSSVIHQEKAIWINMAGRHSTTGDDIVVLELEKMEIQAFKITSAPNQYFQNLVLNGSNLLLVGYEISKIGVVTIMRKVDIAGMRIFPWKKIVENRPRGIPSIPIHVFGTDMLIVYEKSSGW